MEDSRQNTVSTIQYTIVEYFIENFKQKRIQIVHDLSLSFDTVKSNTHLFQLEHVLDISYKGFSTGGGHLYLHTNQGVFAFVIKKDPKDFIQAYKRLKN